MSPTITVLMLCLWHSDRSKSKVLGVTNKSVTACRV